MFVCLFCCSQIAQYQQGHFELIVDWSQSNKYFIELKIAEFFFVWLGGKSCPTKYKRVGYKLRFLTGNVSTDIQRILLICYS